MIFGMVFSPELARKNGMELYDFCEGIVTSITNSHCEYVEPTAEIFVTDDLVFGDYNYAEGWVGDTETTPEARDEEFLDVVAQVVVLDQKLSSSEVDALVDRLVESSWKDDFTFDVDRNYLLEGYKSFGSEAELLLRYGIYALNATDFTVNVFHLDNEEGIEQYTVVVFTVAEEAEGGELILERLLPRLEEANEEIIVH